MSTASSLSIRRKHVHRETQRFTPGPYHVAGSGPRVRSLKSAGGRTIAHVLFSARHESEGEATAQLLAAAPDLLLALRACVAACPCGQHSDGIARLRPTNSRCDCPHCAPAVAVIRKAEGQ